MSDKSRFIVLQPVRYNRENYEINSTIELGERDADELLRLKCIKPFVADMTGAARVVADVDGLQTKITDLLAKLAEKDNLLATRDGQLAWADSATVEAQAHVNTLLARVEELTQQLAEQQAKVQAADAPADTATEAAGGKGAGAKSGK